MEVIFVHSSCSMKVIFSRFSCEKLVSFSIQVRCRRSFLVFTMDDVVDLLMDDGVSES